MSPQVAWSLGLNIAGTYSEKRCMGDKLPGRRLSPFLLALSRHFSRFGYSRSGEGLGNGDSATLPAPPPSQGDVAW